MVIDIHENQIDGFGLKETVKIQRYFFDGVSFAPYSIWPKTILATILPIIELIRL